MGGGTHAQLDESISEDFDPMGKETGKLSSLASFCLRLDHIQKTDIRIGSKLQHRDRTGLRISQFRNFQSSPSEIRRD